MKQFIDGDADSFVMRPQEAEMSCPRVRCVGLIALLLLACGGCQTLTRFPLMPRSAGLPAQYEGAADETR